MKIAFYISGKASRLCEILLDSRSGQIISNLPFVLSDEWEEGEEIREICKRTGIKYIFYDYKNQYTECERKERNRKLSDEILLQLKEYEIDYLFVFGHHLLSGELLDIYKDHIIVFHPSILPSYRGFSAIDHAMENHEFVVGNTAFLIDEGMDTGKIIMQSIMHSSNFGENDYNALLHPIVDMFYQLWNCIKEQRIRVEEDGVRIEGADYKSVHFYPEIRK